MNYRLNKIIATIVMGVISVPVMAQVNDPVLQKLRERGYDLDSTVVENRDIVIDKNVVTNPFYHNAFITASVGAHTYRGDFSTYGSFGKTVSPDWYVGIGKWFTPVVGFKVELGMSESKGFMDEKYPTPYCYGDLQTNSKGNKFWQTRNKWLDLSGSAMINLSRALYGYEGALSPKLMNQFILNAGLGYVHHRGLDKSLNIADEWSGHLELQYSRFLTKSKKVSLDLKARLLAYQTNFDKHDVHKGSSQFDANVGLSVGVTFYLKHHVWGYNAKTQYITNYVTQVHTDTIKAQKVKAPEYGQATFYVFYPNNYSGRNDAPQIKGAAVNAIDYLAGGLYTQKQYKDNGQVAMRLGNNKSTNGLEYIDIPTVKANVIDGSDGYAHGYEMSTWPLSFSLEKDSLISFREKKGFYYAPIWDGQNAWQYRIDDATKGQRLIDPVNYKETVSYGLNAHQGLKYVREWKGQNNGERLFSFADVYAAIEGNAGYVSKYADAESVAWLSRVFNEGTITSISVTGVATSQDSNKNLALTRNTALAQNRANTVVAWLQGCSCKRIAEAQSQTFLVNETEGPIRQVDDMNIRSLNAKMNRCVKVTIHYMIQE